MKQRSVGQTRTSGERGTGGAGKALARSGALLLCAGLCAGLGLTSCTSPLPDIDEDAFGDFEADANAEIQAILRLLFPDLDDEEIAELSVSISYEEVVALRAELEEVRKAAAEFSADLFKTAEERARERSEDLSSASRTRWAST